MERGSDLALFGWRPAIRKEVVDLRSLGGRESGQHVFHVFKWIEAQPLACFDQTHDRCGSLSTFFGASKEPVAPVEHHRLDASFAGIVADLDEGMFQVNHERRPAIERVRNCFSKFGFWK